MFDALSIRKGIAAACVQILAAGFLLLLLVSPLHAQLSPGPLSKAHQSLSGTTQCTSCHTLRVGARELKCVECHVEIGQRLKEHRGLHATLVKNPADGQECAKCHSEHNGADFYLIHWDGPINSFDHRKAGYLLEGKHAQIECAKCHTPANIIPTQRTQIKVQDLTRTWLGLSKDCVTCHKDPHNGRLGPNCTECHNFSDWKAASGFDHSKTRYPLTGLHIKVACEKCHAPSTPGGSARLTGMAFGSCADCHKDPHRGSFTQTCDTCHTTSGWNSVRMPSSFDHSKTKYPLLGKHVSVACEDCHARGDFKKPVAFAQCVDCHTPDPHKGQFSARADKGECASCHTVNGFKPSTYGVKEHASSKYPLEGKHVKVECAKCHLPAGKDTIYKVKFELCADCHKDVHDGQFAAAPYKNRCEECHTVKDFHRTNFSIAMHRKTRFVLTGAHVAVSCADCHKVGLGGRKDKVLPFHFEDRTCTACHQDPHHGEFKERMAALRANGSPLGCEACHNVRSWTDVTGFDHSKTKFPLEGAHRGVSCGECHMAPAGSHEVQFKGAPKNCEACHADPHAGQFAAKDRTTVCGDCHAVKSWVPSTFDHDKRTQFPLQGGHAGVECAMCHTLLREIEGKFILFYKPTPKNCTDCHGADVRPL
jgi:hypothetical protein